jgi:hypothetical protein
MSRPRFAGFGTGPRGLSREFNFVILMAVLCSNTQDALFLASQIDAVILVGNARHSTGSLIQDASPCAAIRADA